ncbi:MAG: bile acid:sodium symporter family protein [Planctomycetia bacterium]|nr:bile acid:sodium symporter family protein [Planctomycetia bacterium]
MKSFLKKFGLDTFVLCLFGVIFLAWLYPPPGASEDLFSLSTVAKYGISVIFFFYGVRLNWQKIYEGLFNYKLHLVVHFTTFVLFPLIALPMTWYFTQDCNESTRWMWYGIFFMATLPSTVSSSVVMVNIARGNLPAAIFDASISSLLGVFITPLWMQIFVGQGNGGGDLLGVILNLVLLVVVPVVAGIMCNRPLGGFSRKYDVLLRKFDQGIILLIVYTSFCHSFAEKMFDEMTFTTLILLSVGMVSFFFVVFFIVNLISYWLRFNREDRITALFCGSKKSLVHGATMSKVILPDPQLAGVLLLPIMLYHAYQLIVVSVIAQRFAKDKEKD